MGPAVPIRAENLPAQAEHTRAEQDHNVAVNTLHGAVQAVGINLYNPFLGIDLVRLGASNFELGLLSSLPPLAAMVSNIAGARWLAHRAHPQRASAAMFALARLLLIGLALLNLWRQPGPAAAWRAAAVVALVGLLNVPAAVGNLGWQALLTGMLKPEVRASALGRRGIMASLAGVAVAMLVGWLAASWRGTEGYCWLYLAAAAAGLLEVWVFLHLRGSPAIGAPSSLWGAAARLWHNRPYRGYTLSLLPFYLGWLMAWPLFLRYQVSIAHATNLWMGAFTSVNALAAVMGNLLWSRVGNRLGARLALPLACLGLSGVPAGYALGPGLVGILGTNVLGGLMGAGVNLYVLVRLMEVAPAEERVVAMGVANTVIGAVGVVGPLVGTALLRVVPSPQVFWIPWALRVSGGLALLGTAVADARRQRG